MEEKMEEKKEEKKEEVKSKEKTSSKSKKIYIIIIAALCLVICGLVAVIFSKNNEKKQKNPVTTEEIASNSDADNKSSEDENEGEAKQEDKLDDNSSEKKACYVTITKGSGWDNGGKYCLQIDGYVYNNSKEDIKDWKVTVSGCSNATVTDSWNGKFSVSGDDLVVTAVDYNGVVAAGQNISFGLILSVDSKETADKLGEKAILYVDGKEYTKVEETKTEEKDTEEKEETNTEENKNTEQKKPEKTETGTALSNHGALSVKGVDLVDKNGDKYQLKGVSTHGLSWFPEYLNKDALQTLRDDWGANVIRLAMYTAEYAGYCSGGDKDELKKLIDNGVNYANELGIYVIIDWHILSDGNPLTNQDEAVKFFDEMSAKYKDYDNVLYEICNEPNGGTTWADVKKYAETVIPVIRKNDKEAIIIVGTPTWSQDVDIAAEDPITGYDNIMYTVHFYAATHKDNIRNKLTTARDKGLAVIVSEFSICDASGNGGIDYNEAEKWMDLLNKDNISFIGWNLSNKDETSSLISSSCKKTSGWTDDDLSETGKWLKEQIKAQ